MSSNGNGHYETDDARQLLARELRRLQVQSGMSLRELARQTLSSDSALSRYLAGQVVPPWPVTEALSVTGKGDLDSLRVLWEQARSARLDDRLRPAPSPPTVAEHPGAGPDLGPDATTASPTPVAPATVAGTDCDADGWRQPMMMRRSVAAWVAMASVGVGLLIGRLTWGADPPDEVMDGPVLQSATARPTPARGVPPTIPSAQPSRSASQNGASPAPSASARPGAVGTTEVAPSTQRRLLAGGTGECLAADYLAVYMISCADAPAKAQTWLLMPLGNAQYKIQAAIGRCLANLDSHTVRTVDCSGGDPGMIWIWDSNSRLWNVHTGHSLVADLAHNVYLHPDEAPGQFWTLR
ncbi:hypothetical protein Cme02nite_51080 [Catellatospora methionotrophica]|uniref:Helix-turn-helix domain-containing protein n=1 Tax=Catellatospora methionotrophica TaxID=121620 RepID=A0A8J3LKC5_9ACTN|nr:helix-turn-helix domain-containing protein [Catellatospora methionotrophica]GIG16776.1 hypothetical protein Cme02nite_51080 [Catellatospora methionotrophica]